MGYRPSFVAIIVAILCAQSASAYDIQQASKETGMSPALIHAIALEESRRVDTKAGAERPWMWTLHANQKPMWFQTRRQAEQRLMRLLDQGVRNIDVGAMQINLRWNGDLVDHPADLLDPAVNLWAFTQVVLECQARIGREIGRVLSCYHAGSDKRHHGKAYARRVLERYHQMQWSYQQ